VQAQSGVAPGQLGARNTKIERRVPRYEVRVKYRFMRTLQSEFQVRVICRVLGVHLSGFYAWLQTHEDPRAKANRRSVGLITQAWPESGGVYRNRNITLDVEELSEKCSKIWV